MTARSGLCTIVVMAGEDSPTKADAFRQRVREVDDGELLGLLFKYVEIADLVDPDLISERLPLLAAVAVERGCLETEERSPYADIDYYSAREYRKDLAMVVYLSGNANVRDLIELLDLSKPRVKRSICPLCNRPRVREGDDLCDGCSEYVFGSVARTGGFEAECYSPPIVRAFAPICYLCGDEPTDHAEHVIAKGRGGSDHLSNLGGACWFCNISKGDRPLDPTTEQVERLAAQQAAHETALAQYTTPEAIDAMWTAFLLESWGDWIDDAVEDLWEDYPDVDREDVMFYIEQVSEDDREEYPTMPDDLEDRAVAETMRRIVERNDPEAPIEPRPRSKTRTFRMIDLG